jgi:hypothetical protein
MQSLFPSRPNGFGEKVAMASIRGHLDVEQSVEEWEELR